MTLFSPIFNRVFGPLGLLVAVTAFGVLSPLSQVFAQAPLPADTIRPATPPIPADRLSLLDVARMGDHDWRHQRVSGRTDYYVVRAGGRLAVRAQGRTGASGLMRRVELDSTVCPVLHWNWRVDQVQRGSNLANKNGDDVAASLFLLFGDPGSGLLPNKVPTLRYVWTGGTHAKDTVIDSPYLPGLVKSVVIRNGDAPLGSWLMERRDVHRDYERAFGEAPRATVQAILLFTDNDQTKQPVTAYYGKVDASCSAKRSLER